MQQQVEQMRFHHFIEIEHQSDFDAQSVEEIIGDNWEEVESRYTRWKKALQEKGMKINVNNTKAFYTRRNFVLNANAKVSLLCMWHKWEETPCILQNVNTGCTRGVLEFMEI